MKFISSSLDRKEIYKIDAARYSYLIISLSFTELIDCLRKVEKDKKSLSNGLTAIRLAWQFIDYGFRFSRLLRQIRNLKQNDPVYKISNRRLQNIEKARNFIQHLNSSIPKADYIMYPVLGAISWPSQDLQKSFTLSLGTFPSGTHFHSLAYDRHEQHYIDTINISIDTFSVNIKESYGLLSDCSAHFEAWLSSIGILTDIDAKPNIIETPALNFDQENVQIVFNSNT